MKEFVDRTILSGEDPYYPEISEEERITDEDVPQAVGFNGLSSVTLKSAKTGVSKLCDVGDTFEGWMIDEIIEFDEKALAVLERNFESHGVFAFVSEDDVVSKIRKSVGTVCSKQISHDVMYPEGYFKRLSDSKEDMLAARVISALGEPSYKGLVDLLPPIANPYHFLRLSREPYRLIVNWNGSIPACFDEELFHRYMFHEFVSLPPMHENKALEIKKGLLGYLPAIDFSYYNEERHKGTEEIAFTLEDERLNSQIYIRIRVYDRGRIWETPTGKDFYYLYWKEPPGEVKDFYFTGIPAQPTSDSKSFYKALLTLRLQWDEFLSKGTKITTPEERVNDIYKAGLIQAMENAEGREWPRRTKHGSRKYGRPGGITGPEGNAGVANCFLDCGFTKEAKDIIGYYLTNYVKSDRTFRRRRGTAPVEWGLLLESAARCFTVTKDYVWVEEHFNYIELIFNYILRERERSKSVNPPESIYHGLTLGVLEVDYSRQPPIYNYSNDVCCWGGLYEMGKTLVEVGRERLNNSVIENGEMLLREAKAYKEDILKSMEKTYNKTPKPSFLPVIVGIKDPYPYLTVDNDASYVNYHLYPNLLGAGFLDEEKATSVIRFREERGGELLGTTRFVDWMDDWPVIGYGWALINHGFVNKLLMLYYGHMAHHQNRGTFAGYEQIEFKDTNGRGRLIIQDNCIHTTLVNPHLTRLMLVFEEREMDVVWLNKAAPRRWFEDGKEIRVHDAITRFGKLSYTVCSKIANRIITSKLTLSERGFNADIKLRLRSPKGYRIQRVELNGKEWAKFDADREVITIPKGMKGEIEIRAHY